MSAKPLAMPVKDGEVLLLDANYQVGEGAEAADVDVEDAAAVVAVVELIFCTLHFCYLHFLLSCGVKTQRAVFEAPMLSKKYLKCIEWPRLPVQMCSKKKR